MKLRFGDLPRRNDEASESIAARTAKRYPFGVGHPEDIAQAALFLSANESRMVNGVVLAADRGMSAF